jgi:hypothetical protein
MQFRITADANSSTGGEATISVSPEIIATGPNKNISSASVADNSIVYVNGVDGTSAQAVHNTAVAYTQDALTVVTVPQGRMDVPDSYEFVSKDTGIAIRVSKQGEIKNNLNFLRIDVLPGYRWFPEQAIRIIS